MGVMLLLVKNWHGVGWCAWKSLIMKWANTLKESSKKSTEAKHSLSQLRQRVHGYRWVPRIPTGSGSLYHKGPALQKIILVFWGVPPHRWWDKLTSSTS